MSHNPLIARNAGYVSASTRSRCLLQYGYFGFRFLRYLCFPWLVLAVTPVKLLFASEVKRIRLQIRWFSAIARIDFVSVYGLLNELLW